VCALSWARGIEHTVAHGPEGEIWAYRRASSAILVVLRHLIVHLSELGPRAIAIHSTRSCSSAAAFARLRLVRSLPPTLGMSEKAVAAEVAETEGRVKALRAS
jgi:hypothetical protein